MAAFGSRVVLGSRVTVTGKKGVVKFIGPTDFAAGDWIGVELDLDEGKNNGVVNGVHYFDCREGHGLFVKKAQVRLDRTAAFSTTTSATLDAKLSSSTAPTGAARASSRLQAIREKNKALKETLAAGKASPQRRAFGSSSGGSRSPGVDSGQEEANLLGSPASVVSIGSVGSETRRASQAFPRDGNDGAAASSPSPASITRPAVDGRARKAFGDASPTTPSLGGTRAARSTGIPSVRRQADSKKAEPVADESFPASPMPHPPSRAIDQPTTNAEMEALRAKAAHAASDSEEAHARLGEAVTKLDASEACCRELERKLSLLRKKSENALGEERLKASALAKEKAAAAAAGRREADMESQVTELTDACEALTLDKEQLALEKEELQEKVDELQMELDSSKLDLEHAQLSAKENEAAARALSAAGGSSGDGGVDVKMLAEQNVQLKEALKRLHSHSVAEKTQLTKAVRSLEKEAKSCATLQDEVDKLRSWKDSKAAEIEDLMEKLDESKAYEEMVEALTTKNLELGERCGELEATMADLESSVQLSEELEVQQAEDIRELQAELTEREVSLHNQKLALESVVKELKDTKQTIDRFREYADQLKASRDELAAASKTEIGSAALNTPEKRALLTQKASMEKMAAEARRAKMSERLLQVDLLDAQARSSRVSMLLPGSLVLAETELRCIDADLGVCRLIRKAGIALELLELPAIEFIDMFASAPPKEPSVEGSETSATDTTLDRATAMEDCSRLALEAEQSLPIAQTVGEALAVLSSTLSVTSSHNPPQDPQQVATTVSSEVASAVIEAEELVDDLLRVIQDEGGLRPAGCTTTLSTLAETIKSICIRRKVAVAPGDSTDNNDDAIIQQQRDTEDNDGNSICAAVTALQDCLVYARRAVLAVTSAALRGTDASRVSIVLLSQREDENSLLWQNARGLWSDLMALRSVANNGERLAELEKLAIGSKSVFEKISTHASDTRTGAPTASELAKQVSSLRVAAKGLLRPPVIGTGVQNAAVLSGLCPRAMWHAVAPWLVGDGNHRPTDPSDNERSIPAPCISTADRVRTSLEEAIDLKPELEATKAQSSNLAVELASKSKELMAAVSRREQLESLLEKAEGSQVASTDLQKQVLLLQETCDKLEQENKFMAEALEDLQDSTSRLEAENRTLKMGSPLKGRAGSASSSKLAQSVGSRGASSTGNLTGIRGSAADVGSASVASQETDESFTSVLDWSRAEVARWRGRAFKSVLSSLKPLPHLSPAQGGRPLSPAQTEEANGEIAGDSIRELLSLSKKLAAVSEPPRVVAVQGATPCGVSPDPVGQDTRSDPKVKGSSDNGEVALSSASMVWQGQQVLNARLEREWKEGQGRAAKALTTLRGGGSGNFGEQVAHQGQGQDAVRVARLRLPSTTTRAVVPITLGRTSLARLQQALTV
eukprot:g10535.t1